MYSILHNIEHSTCRCRIMFVTKIAVLFEALMFLVKCLGLEF